MPRSAPLTIEEARRHLAPLALARRIVLAVSGGPDSVALMHLTAAVGQSTALPPIAVATVDHGLQPGSDRVAAAVAAQARALGFEARILVWDGDKPRTGLQDAARDARYRLLTDYAESIGATHLATAHTLDDQAETILFRMARGSGPAGLAGMRRIVARRTIVHHRPFLDVPKQRLVDACRDAGWVFIEDAANRDPRFARARMREILPKLAAEGLDAQAFAILGRRLAAIDTAIENKAEIALGAARIESGPERHSYSASRLFDEPTAIVSRALDVMLRDFARPGAPRLGRLEPLIAELEEAFRRGETVRRTLHGAVIALRRRSILEITREPPRRRGRPRGDAETGPKG